MKQKNVPALILHFLTPLFDFLAERTGFGSGFQQQVINLLVITPHEKVLDIGCGTGSLLHRIAKSQHSEQLIGIDPDSKALEIARVKNTSIAFIEASADSLPFPDNSFDVIVSTLAFHHVPTESKSQAFQEIHRVLTTNGRFLLADYGKTEGWKYKLADKLLEVFRLPEAKTMQENSKGLLPQMLHKAGFIFEEIAPRYKGIDFLLCHKK